MGLNVSALTDYNNQVAGELLPKIVYTGNTAEYVTIKEGVKYLEPLNLFEVDLYVQDGNACATTASGSATFSQRNLQVCTRQSFDGICLKELDPKYLGISSLGAGSYNETWELASQYGELIANQMRKKNEVFIWTATSGSGAGGDCGIDGLSTIISGSTAGVTTTGSAAATLANMDTMIASLKR